MKERMVRQFGNKNMDEVIRFLVWNILIFSITAMLYMENDFAIWEKACAISGCVLYTIFIVKASDDVEYTSIIKGMCGYFLLGNLFGVVFESTLMLALMYLSPYFLMGVLFIYIKFIPDK